MNNCISCGRDTANKSQICSKCNTSTSVSGKGRGYISREWEVAFENIAEDREFDKPDSESAYNGDIGINELNNEEARNRR